MRSRRWGWRVLRGLAVGLGGAWALGLMWVACELWARSGEGWRVGTVEVSVGPWWPWVVGSAGVYVWLFLVCDDVCPRGSRRAGGPMKAGAVLVCGVAAAGEVARWVW
ncbi:MAG: hypothetical protein AAFY08_15830 [Planctomycetota bacterium]